MRTTAFVLIAMASFAIGCERKPDSKIEVDAPGVNVNVDSKKGVEVDAPGVHVDSSRQDGTQVDVDTEPAK